MTKITISTMERRKCGSCKKYKNNFCIKHKIPRNTNYKACTDYND